MQKSRTVSVSAFAVITFFAMGAAIITLFTHAVYAAQPTVNLGTASPFAVLAGTPNITDAGNSSSINGDVGLSPASGAGIGVGCAQVSGDIYSVDGAGPLPCRVTNGPLLVTAKNDLATAYDDAAGRTPLTTVPTELGGTTLVAGVYDSNSTTFDITAGAGPLVLDGQNDPSSVFIFQAPFEGTGLVVGPASVVTLTNGAQACNVFWRVDTASINTTAAFIGTILALNSITVANGASIEGRLLARNGSVTLENNIITASICAGNDTVGSTPGLPDTGNNGAQYVLWAAVSLLIATIASLLGYAVYKKRAA